MIDITDIKSSAEEIFPEMVQIRRRLHMHPEVSFKEYETTTFIVDYLTDLGYNVLQPLETGCVAILKGGKKSDRKIALRADIDALPMDETGDHKAAFISQNEGVAHCCGHDVHTTNLLGAAKLISERKADLEGTVVLIFQPGEEKIPGGGRLLCETGVLQKMNIERIYGLHTFPGLRAGEIALREGPFMARPDEFRLIIHGKGGHAAAPHEAVDPIVIASQIITNMQSIVSRAIDPTESAVVTVGKITGGSAHNVIPEKVEILGTIRTFDENTAMLISERIQKIASGISEAHGGSAEYHFDPGYPAVVNDPEVTNKLRKVSGEMLPESDIKELEKPIMAGEDFAFYLEHFPGSFFFLGSGSEECGAIYPWHHPQYNVDEEAMKTGVAMLTSLAFNG